RPAWEVHRASGPADLAHAEGARARRPARVRLRPRLRLGVRGVRRVGIDVGGTNTDAVLLEGDRVVHAVKTPTTGDVTTGITRALDLLLKRSEEHTSELQSLAYLVCRLLLEKKKQ